MLLTASKEVENAFCSAKMSLTFANDKWSCEGAMPLQLWSWKGATLVAELWSCKQWSWNVLFLMTDLGVLMLGLCGGTLSVCSGSLKVTFLVVDMASKAEDVETSLGTLNSIIPSLSDDAYYSNNLGHVVSSNM